MRRRDLLIMGCAALASSVDIRAVSAQNSYQKIGLLSGTSAAGYRRDVDSVILGLSDEGFSNNVNLEISESWADGSYDRLPALVSSMLAERVSAIVAIGGTESALAAKRATAITPIVFVIGADPVAAKLVSSLGRPDGNLTGMTLFSTALLGKRLTLLKELIPNLRSAAFLVNPNSPFASRDLEVTTEAGRLLNVIVVPYYVDRSPGFDAAFHSMASNNVDACMQSSDALFANYSESLASLSDQFRIPILHNSRLGPEAGGLMSYAADRKEIYRGAGRYAGRVLKGELPSSLPIQQPRNFELVINMNAAQRLGLYVPLSLQATAELI